MPRNADKRNECIASTHNLRTEQFQANRENASKISKFFTSYFGHSVFFTNRFGWNKLRWKGSGELLKTSARAREWKRAIEARYLPKKNKIFLVIFEGGRRRIVPTLSKKFLDFFLTPALERGMVDVHNCRTTDGSEEKLWGGGSLPTLGYPAPPPEHYFWKLFKGICSVALPVPTVKIWCWCNSPLQRDRVVKLSEFL